MACKVVAIKCSACGHHETGVLREDGSYLALKPGMEVILPYNRPYQEVCQSCHADWEGDEPRNCKIFADSGFCKFL